MFDTPTVHDTALALIKRLEEITADPSYNGVFSFAQVHGVVYNGPNYKSELAALKTALRNDNEAP